MDDANTNDNSQVSLPEEPLPEPVETQPRSSEESPDEVVEPEGGESPTPYIDHDRYKDLDEDPPVEDEELDEVPQEEAPDLWDFLQEHYQPEQLQGLAQELAWGYLRDDTGEINIDSVQQILDQLTDQPGSVLAADVVGFIDAVQRGTINPEAINRDIEFYDHYRSTQNEIYKGRLTQEAHERTTQVQDFVQSVDLPGRLTSMIDRFGLAPTEDDSRLSADFKAALHDRMVYAVDSFAANNPHLKTVMESVHAASQPGPGPTIKDLQNDAVFQISYQRGMQELHRHLGKSLAKEALMHKYLIAGFAALNPPTEETNA